MNNNINEFTRSVLSSERTVWITWENHRRSFELAKEFGVKLYVLDYSTNPIIRYLYASFKTIKILFRIRPTVVFVQNPSIVLAALICFLRNLFKYIVIVDRHTNFCLGGTSLYAPSDIAFKILSKYSLKNANLTIVTNKFLGDIVEKEGGKGAVLTDKLPEFEFRNKKPLRGRYNIVYISTFAEDEPFLAVFNAAKKIKDDVCIYVTGNYKKVADKIPTDLAGNIILTGFLSDNDFIELLYSADAIMDFTTAEWTLVCGGYESMAVGKPFITSNTRVLCEYYTKGAIHTDNTADGIADGINLFLANKNKLETEIKQLKTEKNQEWENMAKAFLVELRNIRRYSQ